MHNQRIERLWRDTFRCAVSLFYQVFYYLEDQGYLDSDCELDLFSLHYVYIPKINNALKMFMDGWNNHAITTENNQSPVQLFTTGTLMRNTFLHQTVPSESENTNLGELSVAGIVVPVTRNPLNSHHTTGLHTLYSTIQLDDNDYGIDEYIQVRRYVHDNYTS